MFCCENKSYFMKKLYKITFSNQYKVSAWISTTSTHVSGFGGAECKTIGMDGQWADTNCTHLHHFVCQFGEGMSFIQYSFSY